jgi:hypothetical protein
MTTTFRCALAGLATALLMPLAVQAQAHRHFPANALRGELLFGTPPEAVLNGQPIRLAPGARIRGENNLLVMSGALAGGKFVVHYTKEDISGLVMDVWILNPAERANRLWPTNERDAKAWLFDPAAQSWTKP